MVLGKGAPSQGNSSVYMEIRSLRSMIAVLIVRYCNVNSNDKFQYGHIDYTKNRAKSDQPQLDMVGTINSNEKSYLAARLLHLIGLILSVWEDNFKR